MEHIKHDGAAEPAPVVTVALSKEPPARRERAVTKPAAMSKLRAAQEAVRDFLVKQCQAREVRLTKIAPSAGDRQGWYAEAEILVPDLGIKTLGLELSQEVLEREFCAVDLDSEMNVKSYEVLDPRDR
jgi:hypothetical protein